MIFDKVEELCELIEDTKQYNDYLEAEVELENDGKGMDFIKDFNDLQEEYIRIYSEATKEDIETLERILENRHTELLAHTTTSAYIRTKQALDELLEEINKNILIHLGLITKPDGCDFCSHATCEDGCCDNTNQDDVLEEQDVCEEDSCENGCMDCN